MVRTEKHLVISREEWEACKKDNEEYKKRYNLPYIELEGARVFDWEIEEVDASTDEDIFFERESGPDARCVGTLNYIDPEHLDKASVLGEMKGDVLKKINRLLKDLESAKEQYGELLSLH